MTFSIAKRIQPVVQIPSQEDVDPELWPHFEVFKTGMHGRLSHVVHFAALLCAGFGGMSDRVHWVCDQDNLTTTTTHQEALASLTQNTLLNMLEGVGPQLTISVDAEEGLPVLAEDFVSICDIAAGAYAALEACPIRSIVSIPAGELRYPDIDPNHKSIEILDLLRTVRGSPLREIMISATPFPISPGLMVIPKSYEY